MIVAGIYSFNGGLERVNEKYPRLLKEIQEVISRIEAAKHKTKNSEEKTMPGKILFDPKSLNKAFKKEFGDRGWESVRVKCEYSKGYYTANYDPPKLRGNAFREMDFVKKKLGVEVQFGKYSFMVYNVCAKMTIFNKMGFIDTGVEIVPVKRFADEMSTGVSYFEQFLWDLEQRGIFNIDIPVLILGIDDEFHKPSKTMIVENPPYKKLPQLTSPPRTEKTSLAKRKK